MSKIEKFVCKNIKGQKKAFYTGTEPSPKGLGYCARFEKIGTKMKGKDKNIWIVQSKSSGSRAWVKEKNAKAKNTKAKNAKDTKNTKAKDTKDTKSKLIKTSLFSAMDRFPLPEDLHGKHGKTIKTYNYSKWDSWQSDISPKQQSIHNKLVKLGSVFNKNGISILYCIWKRDEQYGFIVDNQWDVLEAKDKNYDDKPYIIISFKMDSNKFINLEKICLQHNLFSDWKPIVDKIMIKEFKNSYKWNGSNSKSICILV